MDQSLESELKQNTVLVTIQKVQHSLSRTALAVLFMTSLGIAGRAAFQYIPSVEPLTPLAIVSGFVLGPVNGFVSGATGFYLSNYVVWGGQGPWTIFQALGAGIAGFLGGIFSKTLHNRLGLLVSTLLGITIYEILVNIGGSITSLIPLPLYFITSLPFSITHLVSSLGFVLFFYEFKDKIKNLRGETIEKRILGFRYLAGSNRNPNTKYLPFFYFRERRDSKGRAHSILWSSDKE